MSTPIYSFLPWLRSGIANNITQADGDASVKVRATIPLDLTLTGTNLDGSANNQPLHRDVSLYGPGDIIGIDTRAIVKTDPRNYITNFESNYLAFIEFYDEDFPWRYTPAAADVANSRLRPWIALVVLKETEFSDGKDVTGKPLNYIELATGVDPSAVFPAPSQLWAWAHVHANVDLSNNGDESMPGVIQRLQDTIASNPDLAYSRILCPRQLEADTVYHAFLIPAFESGRLAGLGQAIPDGTVATASAWDNHQTQHPYYYRFYFRTGDFGDFEYLVNLLQPRPVDSRVGVRDMDVLHPGSNLPPINTPIDLGGILRLGGALQAPFATMPPADQEAASKYDEWDQPFPHAFETAIAALINLADDYSRNSASGVNRDGDPDPVVTSPLYGRWPARLNRVVTAADGSPLPNDQDWVHRLNLDPRFRVAAGLGTGVVQQNQQQYMNAAWEQVGDVLSANDWLRHAQLAVAVGMGLHTRHIASLSQESALLLTAPMHARVMGSATTVAAQLGASGVPPAVTSAVFRRITRRGTALMSRLALPPTTGAKVITSINAGTIAPSPPKPPVTGATTIGDAVNAIASSGKATWIEQMLAEDPWLRLLPGWLRAALFDLLTQWTQPQAPGTVAELLARHPWLRFLPQPLIAALFNLLTQWSQAEHGRGAIDEEQQTPASVDNLPSVSNFVISDPSAPITPVPGPDSAEAIKFKQGLRDVYTFTSISFPVAAKLPVDLPALTAAVVAGIDPRLTIPRRLGQTIMLPPWIVNNLVEQLRPVMAYPVFNIPMYKPLSDMSSELFLPNINLIPQNSMTLLESNQRFIESYMVGLNHEMARELLWNEYPTDQQGSYFRQFWDVSTLLPPNPTDADRELLRDIPPLHEWSLASNLGTHNQREQNSQAALLTLVIRGDLLKRYPTAVIYAQRAQWQKNDRGGIDTTQDRVLVDLSPSEEDSPPTSKVRTPLFEAKVDPDIYFIGFDLSATEAKGSTTGTNPDPGWFFVIKERPGEPRFGMNDAQQGTTPRMINWNDLSWAKAGITPGQLIQLSGTLTFDAYDANQDHEDKPDPDDAQAQWTPNTDASELAYILYRVPVLVAVHASRMLP